MKKNKFMECISKQFSTIKNSFNKRINDMGLTFDDDVFSQTIIQCNAKLMNCDIIDEEMIKYFWKAFKNNTLRELKYMRNKTTDEIPEDIIQIDYDIEEDFNNITNMLINEFGEELYQLFALHANGTPYKELIKITRITNLKYKFRRMREYIRNNYKKE